MSSRQEYPIQAMGFWMIGFLSVVLAVLKTYGGAVCVLVADCQRPQSRARLKPEIMTATFEEFSPTHDFFDYTGIDQRKPSVAGRQRRETMHPLRTSERARWTDRWKLRQVGLVLALLPRSHE